MYRHNRPMLCARCARITRITETPLHLESHNITGAVCRLDCEACGLYIAARLSDALVDVDDINQDVGSTWKEANTNRERLCYYILCRIIYPEIDTPRSENLETLYDLADTSDVVVLRWENGSAIGFYTLKPKGTEIPFTGERYTMPVVDTAYIRSSYRRKGFGSEILTDVVRRFPNEDIGFSRPISVGMLEVLRKFLSNYKEHRLRFWELADCDIGVSQQLIWLKLKKKRRDLTASEIAR